MAVAGEGNLEIQQFQVKIYYLPDPSGNQSGLLTNPVAHHVYTRRLQWYMGDFSTSHASLPECLSHTHSVHVLPIIPGQWAAQASTRN